MTRSSRFSNFNDNCFSSATELIEKALGNDYFYPTEKDGTPIIPAFYSDTKSKCVVIVGENGSGKTFFRRLLKNIINKSTKDIIEISMEGRKSFQPINQNNQPQHSNYFNGYAGGYNYSIFNNVDYGSEIENPTGINSINAVLGVISNSRKKYSQHVLFFDNPELGLSDASAAGLGLVIKEFMHPSPDNVLATIVSTHSKSLAKELLPLNPQYLYLGLNKLAPKSLDEWINKPVIPRQVNDIISSVQRRTKLLSDLTRGLK